MDPIAIDPALVERYVLELARHGACAETGVCRAMYTPEWEAAQTQVAEWCVEAGMRPWRSQLATVARLTPSMRETSLRPMSWLPCAGLFCVATIEFPLTMRTYGVARLPAWLILPGEAGVATTVDGHWPEGPGYPDEVGERTVQTFRDTAHPVRRTPFGTNVTHDACHEPLSAGRRAQESRVRPAAGPAFSHLAPLRSTAYGWREGSGARNTTGFVLAGHGP